MRLDNALNKDYALAYEGSQEGGNSYVYQTPGVAFIQTCAIISKIKLL